MLCLFLFVRADDTMLVCVSVRVDLEASRQGRAVGASRFRGSALQCSEGRMACLRLRSALSLLVPASPEMYVVPHITMLPDEPCACNLAAVWNWLFVEVERRYLVVLSSILLALMTTYIICRSPESFLPSVT